MGELLIRVLLVKLVEGTRWREKDRWQHPQTLPMLQVATSLHLGSNIFQEKNHSGGMHFKEIMGKEGKL